MSNSRERAAELGQRLLLSAKDDDLGANRLAAALERLDTVEAAAPRSRLPLGVVLVTGSFLALGAAATYTHSTFRQPPASTHETAIAPPRAAPSPSETRQYTTAETKPETSAPATMSVAALPDAPPVSVPARLQPSEEPAQEDLSAELLAVERIQQTIALRRITDAKAAVAEYHRSFPKKRLAEEVRVLEIELLLAEGRRPEAEARAQTFLSGPGGNGPYAARVRLLIARPGTP